MSVDYLTRLEQARGPRPSEAVLGALARALRLTDAERDHLFDLAGAAPPAPGRIRSAVRPSVLRLMDRFTDLPVLLLDAKTDVLAWNPMAAALLGDLSATPVPMRNVARQAFLGDSRMEVDPEERERLDRALAADLRRRRTHGSGQIRKLIHCTIQVVVADLVVELVAGGELLARRREPPLDLLGAVGSALGQALDERLERGRLDEDQGGLWQRLAHLAGALDVDLEHDPASRSRELAA
jgi:PAS domain-containing protein